MAAPRRPSDETDDLAADAWRLIREAMNHGTMTLKGGKTCTVDPKDFMRLVQWLAGQAPKKPKLLADPKALGLQATDG